MICPACRGELQALSVVGFDDSYRCGGCGGVWMANWAVNSIAEGKELKIVPLNKPKPQSAGTMICPKDGTTLGVVADESAPAQLGIVSCGSCGWWWFGSDTLFEYAKAVNAKKDYMVRWKVGDVARMAFPALVLVLLVGGVVGGVKLVLERQQSVIKAEFAISQFSAVSEYGVVVITFESKKPVEAVEIKGINDLVYAQYPVTLDESGFYRVMVGQLVGGKYQARIGGEVFEFEID